MSLFIPSDGLLGTHVTWKDVESEMQKALKTTATFGEGKKVTNIGDMKGTLSRVGLVEADWKGTKEALPKKFVVKMASQLPLIEATQRMGLASAGDEVDEAGMQKMAAMGALLKSLHNREVDVYDLLTKEKHPSIPFTKVYASRKFNEKNELKAFIITEYFEDLHYFSILNSVASSDIRPVIKSIAAFSAFGEKYPEKKKKLAEGPDFFVITFTQMIDEKMIGVFKQLVGNFVPDEKLREKFIEICTSFYLNPKIIPAYTNINQFLGTSPVLIHGDVWSPNVLFSKLDDKLEYKALIDYQTVTVSSAAQDVAKFFITSLSPKDRNEKLDNLLSYYYDCFVHELHGKPAPYTFQQLKDGYSLLFPLYAVISIFAIAQKLMSFNGEENEKQEAMAKIFAFIEDIVKAHEKNVKQFPEFFKF